MSYSNIKYSFLLILFIFILLFPYHVISQSFTVESIKKLKYKIQREHDSVQKLFKNRIKFAVIYFQSRDYYIAGCEDQEMGLINSSQDYFERAERGFSIVIDSLPRISIVYYFRGLSRFQRENYSSALADFNKSIRLNPKDIDSYYYRGCTKIFLKDTLTTISDFDVVLECDESNMGALINRGLAKQAKKDYFGALSDFSKSIKLYPNSTETYFARGKLQLSVNKYTEAKNDFIQAIIIKPRNIEFYRYLCLVLNNMRKYDFAIEIAKKGLLFKHSDSLLTKYISILNKKRTSILHHQRK